MSTNTAIFQEQKDGTYKGIYVDRYGDIDGVGYTLHTYYQNPEKTAELINRHQWLWELGAKFEEEAGDFIHKACCEDGSVQYSDADGATEYFTADTLEALRRFEYLTFGEEGVPLKFMNIIGDVTEFQGAFEGGYMYVQTLNGEWLVSCEESKDEDIKSWDEGIGHKMNDLERMVDWYVKNRCVGQMSAFEPLAQHFAEDEYEQRCRRYAQRH